MVEPAIGRQNQQTRRIAVQPTDGLETALAQRRRQQLVQDGSLAAVVTARVAARLVKRDVHWLCLPVGAEIRAGPRRQASARPAIRDERGSMGDVRR